jgi:hypothetical protein
MPSAACVAPPEDELVMLETCTAWNFSSGANITRKQYAKCRGLAPPEDE